MIDCLHVPGASHLGTSLIPSYLERICFDEATALPRITPEWWSCFLNPALWSVELERQTMKNKGRLGKTHYRQSIWALTG